MKVISGGVTAPQGFKANGLCCGIKKSGRLDLALLACEQPATAAGCFTTNSIKAAPVVVTQRKIRCKKAQAILINSGNANCFTGNFGLLYAQESTELMARLLNVPEQYVLVASTGIIGETLPYKKIEAAAEELVRGLNPVNGQKAARAILTTDTKIKEIAVEFRLSGKSVRIGACAKGSGMIHPHMATMLAFITSDASIDEKMLKLALRKAIEPSFHSITVDGCMSTNDMVIALSNGLAGNPALRRPTGEFRIFADALRYICGELARKIVLDAEGATKFLEITVRRAATVNQAKKVAMAIATSNLVKTAAYGSDPNWGRVAAAVGSAGLSLTERQLKIKFSSFARKKICIWVDLNCGRREATVYTSDLSEEYIRINGRYH